MVRLSLPHVRMEKCVSLGNHPIEAEWRSAKEVFGDLSAPRMVLATVMLLSSVGCLDTNQITL